MKKLLFILVLFYSTVSFSQTPKGFGNDYIFASDNFIDIDKQYHFSAGAFFAFTGYLWALEYHDGDRDKAKVTGVIFGTVPNLMKEVTDIGKTGFDTNDLAFGVLGAVISVWVTDKIHYPNYMQRKKQEIAEMEKLRISLLTDDEKLLEQIPAN
jgi:hypothetical protein